MSFVLSSATWTYQEVKCLLSLTHDVPIVLFIEPGHSGAVVKFRKTSKARQHITVHYGHGYKIDSEVPTSLVRVVALWHFSPRTGRGFVVFL